MCKQTKTRFGCGHRAEGKIVKCEKKDKSSWLSKLTSSREYCSPILTTPVLEANVCNKCTQERLRQMNDEQGARRKTEQRAGSRRRAPIKGFSPPPLPTYGGGSRGLTPHSPYIVSRERRSGDRDQLWPPPSRREAASTANHSRDPTEQSTTANARDMAIVLWDMDHPHGPPPPPHFLAPTGNDSEATEWVEFLVNALRERREAGQETDPRQVREEQDRRINLRREKIAAQREAERVRTTVAAGRAPTKVPEMPVRKIQPPRGHPMSAVPARKPISRVASGVPAAVKDNRKAPASLPTAVGVEGPGNPLPDALPRRNAVRYAPDARPRPAEKLPKPVRGPGPGHEGEFPQPMSYLPLRRPQLSPSAALPSLVDDTPCPPPGYRWDYEASYSFRQRMETLADKLVAQNTNRPPTPRPPPEKPLPPIPASSAAPRKPRFREHLDDDGDIGNAVHVPGLNVFLRGGAGTTASQGTGSQGASMHRLQKTMSTTTTTTTTHNSTAASTSSGGHRKLLQKNRPPPLSFDQRKLADAAAGKKTRSAGLATPPRSATAFGQALWKSMRPAGSSHSDMSFVCQDARAIERHG